MLAHPYVRAPEAGAQPGLKGAQSGSGGAPAPGARERRTLVAIGPEGGWTDAEVALLEAHGFDRLSLGPRILRTDTAAIALLARLMPTGQP